jgi:hypothetical protein
LCLRVAHLLEGSGFVSDPCVRGLLTFGGCWICVGSCVREPRGLLFVGTVLDLRRVFM